MPKSHKEYIPQEYSGGYAILITLYEQHLKNVPYVSKSNLIRLGQPLAKASFTKPDPGSRYTAWSSMGTLIGKHLVTKTSNPAKFSLTDEGLPLAKKLFDKRKDETRNVGNEVVCMDLSDEEVMPKQQSSSGHISESNQPGTQKIKDKAIQKHASSSSAIVQEDNVWMPGTFDIILYVDTGETRGNNIQIHNDPILSKLKLLLVNYEVKSLNVGDYIWICRDRATKKELVLPYIIERKRMDDFADSVKDGRYREQKFRLKRSGIQNITYLIEKYSNTQFIGLPLTTLYQAATNTAIQDGFCVKFTENCTHTAKYLAHFSSLLIKMFNSKVVVSCTKESLTECHPLTDEIVFLMTFDEFNRSSIKNKPLMVSNLFVKMLIQISGMSVDKALAIVREFPTPATLREAYTQNPGRKGEMLLAQIQLGDYKKTVGPALSKTVYQLFTVQTF